MKYALCYKTIFQNKFRTYTLLGNTSELYKDFYISRIAVYARPFHVKDLQYVELNIILAPFS